ncbi:MAG TPA: sigma-70 factor domain-containing protein, partial [Kofleriaceae bacterium]|nr:sigma-70 factor domain-containing protein [Kofleriaceae bacterium]
MMSTKPAYDLASKTGGVRAPGRRRESPESTLMAYFRDMTGTALLTPERETELAKEIEEREIGTWVSLFSHAPAVEHMISRVESLLDNSLAEFKNLRRAATRAKKARTKAAQQSLETSARKVGVKLRALDIDRAIIEALLDEVHRMERPAATGRGRRPTTGGGAHGPSRATAAWA